VQWCCLHQLQQHEKENEMNRKMMADFGALVVMIGSLMLVLITLSGQTRTYGIWIAVLSIVGQVVTMILSANDGDD
jgi:hypothetical protein